MSVEIEGIDDFIAKLDNAVKKIPKKRNEFVKKSAENLIRYTKDLTPVDTGNLKNNLAKIRFFILPSASSSVISSREGTESVRQHRT